MDSHSEQQSNRPSQQPKSETPAGQPKNIDRRIFLKRAARVAGGATAAAAVAVAFDVPRRALNFLGGLPPHGREILPQNPETVHIPRAVSDAVFEKLGPERFDPESLNADSFFEFAQQAGNLDYTYYSDDSDQRPETFHEHFKQFMKQIDMTAKDLKIGLPQVLLGLATSAMNIGGRKGYNGDVMAEAKIELINKASNMLTSHSDADAGTKEKVLTEVWRTASRFSKQYSMGTLALPRLHHYVR